MAPALARTAAAIHGCCKMSRQPPVPAMVTGRIPAPVGKRNPRRSIPAATVIAMEAGSSIRPVSTGAQAIAETAARRTMIMPATA